MKKILIEKLPGSLSYIGYLIESEDDFNLKVRCEFCENEYSIKDLKKDNVPSFSNLLDLSCPNRKCDPEDFTLLGTYNKDWKDSGDGLDLSLFITSATLIEEE